MVLILFYIHHLYFYVFQIVQLIEQAGNLEFDYRKRKFAKCYYIYETVLNSDLQYYKITL